MVVTYVCTLVLLEWFVLHSNIASSLNELLCMHVCFFENIDAYTAIGLCRKTSVN